MKEVHWEPVANQDKDSITILDIILLCLIAILLIGVCIWNT